MQAANTKCLFVSDLHGSRSRYEKLSAVIDAERPAAILLGGDLFPHALESTFLETYLIPLFISLRSAVKHHYPSVYMILGNDDPRFHEPQIIAAEHDGLWTYLHNRKVSFGQ